MLDFFVIITKGGIRLWCFPGSTDIFRLSINTFLKSLILEENAGRSPFICDSRAMKFYMDNEFNLLFVAAYQKVLQLNYVDKFLTDIALEFRDKYKNKLISHDITGSYEEFLPIYQTTLKKSEDEFRNLRKSVKQMRKFEDSEKSKKTVASMIVRKGKNSESDVKEITVAPKESVVTQPKSEEPPVDNIDTFEQNRLKLAAKLKGSKKSKESKSPSSSPMQKPNGKRVKESRRWDNAATGEEAAALDFSGINHTESTGNHKADYNFSATEIETLSRLRGTMKDDLDEVHVSSDDEDLDVLEIDESESLEQSSFSTDSQPQKTPLKTEQTKSGYLNGGFASSLLRGLRIAGGTGRVLTQEDITPCLEQLRERLVSKNVAMSIAERVCSSVSDRLVGTSLGTFERIYPRVKASLEDVCSRILVSGRRVDVLRDALDARTQGRPYSIVFCGVNGVGKSTNLAKIAFWLIEKNFRVLIAACDTFRSGAVEQLRTHVRKLNYIHPADQHGGQIMVELYEQGYGRDAASIARSAINYARDRHFDVVLVDTAGRMQDNEPLMRALALLIQTNQPDLVLFVGEALVGNEAVDQLVKFNQSLADHSYSDHPRCIDGIVLTKFDTIDDKVGAAISMACISNQPIVFVGTGQTYSDLRQLSVNAVVKALMK
ncbi:Signal recognition particle receptor subunit alpha isoform 2 [Schistosoma japonicum]|uniref:Signal recognition particle receptor subunit alpha isoform 2 n=2 Tax=Schistosoma japonicum TaxID=6182 RepID=A0A4Z2D6Q5_SCHJA|nr:Signal recognition particle receptor subunit alpha isoform 2 [Schistosoma japonicum]